VDGVVQMYGMALPYINYYVDCHVIWASFQANLPYLASFMELLHKIG
jgi:hypothetical protein